MPALRTIQEDGDATAPGVLVLDQTRLPRETAFVRLADLADAARAIRTMQVRGAPLIGATAAYGVALGLAVNGLMGQVGFDYGQFSSLTSYTALITGKVYSTLGLEKIGQRAITTLVIAILASIYPAREASQSEPAMALHHV